MIAAVWICDEVILMPWDLRWDVGIMEWKWGNVILHAAVASLTGKRMSLRVKSEGRSEACPGQAGNLQLIQPDIALELCSQLCELRRGTCVQTQLVDNF